MLEAGGSFAGGRRQEAEGAIPAQKAEGRRQLCWRQEAALLGGRRRKGGSRTTGSRLYKYGMLPSFYSNCK